jgi:hypothetical protein
MKTTEYERGFQDGIWDGSENNPNQSIDKDGTEYANGYFDGLKIVSDKQLSRLAI